MNHPKSGKIERGAEKRTGTTLRANADSWLYGFQYGSPHFILAHSVSELMETQPEWNSNIKKFTPDQVAQGRQWILRISHADLKDPVLFILACKVMFDEKQSKAPFDFKKNGKFTWYTDVSTVIRIEPWNVYQYKKLLQSIDTDDSVADLENMDNIENMDEVEEKF